MLERWKGIPVFKAVEKHAAGIPLPTALEEIRAEAIYAEKYGEVKVQPFTSAWLKDFPQLIEHVESEHLLHVRGADEEGKGFNWPSNKFGWRLNPTFNPEAKSGNASKGGIQMRLGYFIVPLSQMEKFASTSLSKNILNELEVRNASGEIIGYRLFVHPEAYAHYKSLHEANIPFIKPGQSEFIGTPTSSYRSWVVRRVAENQEPSPEAIPFIVKLGVSNSISDTSRLLSKSSIEKSIRVQNEFDKQDPGSFNKGSKGEDFLIFPENLGLALKNVQGYPGAASDDGKPIDSGIIIREFPKELLEGKCKILSFSALMSLERLKKENQGICALDTEEQGMERLPLIYEIIHASIKKGLVKTPLEFFNKYLAQGYLNAIEQIVCQKGLSFSPHGQNLCIVLNNDNTVRGFAYRDHEGISEEVVKGFLESFSWFYRYHVFIKLLHAITQFETERSPPPPGAPAPVGNQKKLPERNLYHYLISQLKDSAKGMKMLHELSLSVEEYEKALHFLDSQYLTMLSRYFDMEKASIMTKEGTFPAAEKGSAEDSPLLKYNLKLWQHSYSQGSCPRPDQVQLPQDIYLGYFKKQSSKAPLINKAAVPSKYSKSLMQIMGWHQKFKAPEKPKEIKVPPPGQKPSIFCIKDLEYKHEYKYKSYGKIPTSP